MTHNASARWIAHLGECHAEVNARDIGSLRFCKHRVVQQVALATPAWTDDLLLIRWTDLPRGSLRWMRARRALLRLHRKPASAPATKSASAPATKSATKKTGATP